MNRRSASIAITLGIAATAAAQPEVEAIRERVVLVRTFDTMGSAFPDLSGFAVGGRFVVTSGRLLAEDLLVVLPETGEELSASLVIRDERADVAILSVESFGAEGFEFVDPGTSPEPGDTLYLPRFGGDGRLDAELTPGSISALQLLPVRTLGEREVLLFRHNAVAAARQYGMPILNHCGEIVGLLRTDPDSSQTVLRARPDPGEAGFGVAAAGILPVLTEAEAEPRIASEPCLSPVAEAERELATARQSQAAAEQRVTELEADSKATEEELAAAREESEAARGEVEEKEAALQSTEEELATRTAQMEQEQQRSRWLAAALIGLAALALVALVLFRRRLARRQEELAESKKELEGAIRPAGFSCLLDGEDANGRSFALKITAEQLGAPEGVVVGRNPEIAGALLDYPQASRQHFRLTAREDGLRITDLHSTNGTVVDGQQLIADKETPVADGSAIQIGDLALRLKVSRAEEA